jgi:NTP pyrophosphatase (non-canonical NTP hydrolase)
VKKQLLASSDESKRSLPTDEIVEELGDIVWYCFALVQLQFPNGNTNIFNREIAFLKRMLTSTAPQFAEFQELLGPAKSQAFLAASDDFPKTADLRFDDFQQLAFMTARTDGALLRQVCLSVLWQHGAELLRFKLPESERKINKKLKDREISYVLGDVAWHVAAIASVYNISLDQIIEKNVEKIEFRLGRSNPTPLHDDNYPPGQRFPRQFEVAFVSVGQRKSRMYLNGRSLGSDLTDNAVDDDGYRFHDVMHLANVAKLGWSPVLRDLMALKRKRDPQVDEVQDGARARIVEEAVIKAIHSEGVRLALQGYVGPLLPHQQNIFPNISDISFGFLKFISSLVSNLEVSSNKYWEWEDAILEGSKLFKSLRTHRQGTVRIDLDKRSLEFSPNVNPDFSGAVAGLGTVVIQAPANGLDDIDDPVVLDGVRAAILRALDLPNAGPDSALQVTMLGESRPSVVADGVVAERIWSRAVVCFRTSFVLDSQKLTCTAIAIADSK